MGALVGLNIVVLLSDCRTSPRQFLAMMGMLAVVPITRRASSFLYVSISLLMANFVFFLLSWFCGHHKS
jgi:hypothetical protein